MGRFAVGNRPVCRYLIRSVAVRVRGARSASRDLVLAYTLNYSKTVPVT
jgi:hypothetical protein